MTELEQKNACKKAIDYIIYKIDQNLDDFHHSYPSPASKNNVYLPTKNVGWTPSFWTGMLCLALEYTGDQKYAEIIESQIIDFRHRLDCQIDLANHDIGFLYSLSCVAYYKLTNDSFAKETALLAAEKLYERFIETAEVIHCWGGMSADLKQARIIVDCLLNLPLLYWASSVSGNEKFARAAYKHALSSQKYLIREGHSTYHSYLFDISSGRAIQGETVQGFNDDSCWARGQAWGIYGFALSYLYTGERVFLKSGKELLGYYMQHIPSDNIPYWDLSFTSGDEERDTSSAAIAACGIRELLHYIPKLDPLNAKYSKLKNDTINSLMSSYMTRQEEKTNGILLHGVYGKPQNNGVDECLIWGDYFYFELLLGEIRSRELYW